MPTRPFKPDPRFTAVPAHLRYPATVPRPWHRAPWVRRAGRLLLVLAGLALWGWLSYGPR